MTLRQIARVPETGGRRSKREIVSHTACHVRDDTACPEMRLAMSLAEMPAPHPLDKAFGRPRTDRFVDRRMLVRCGEESAAPVRPPCQTNMPYARIALSWFPGSAPAPLERSAERRYAHTCRQPLPRQHRRVGDRARLRARNQYRFGNRLEVGPKVDRTLVH